MSIALRALLITLAIQVYVALAAVAVPVLAPVIAPEIGLPTATLGLFVGVIYGGAMLSGLLSATYIERYGPIRFSQFAMLMAALGLAAATGPLALLASSSVVIGVGYGIVNPASSHILVRTTPPEKLALTFSLKQSGVPLGAAIAGVLLPAMALAFGWRLSLWLLAGAGLLVVVAAQAIRPALDTELHPDRRLSIGAVLAPLRLYLADAGLRELGRTGMINALMQSSLMSFLVTFLSAEAGWSLIAAGFALAVLNGAAVASRVAWGMVADRWIPPRRLLGWLSIVSGACGLLMTAVGVEWPISAMLGLCAAYGAVAIGWTGVQLAEVARASPPGRAASVTGANGFVTSAGVLLGPPLFGALAGLTGSYRAGFAVLGVTSLANGCLLAWRHRARAARGESPPDKRG